MPLSTINSNSIGNGTVVAADILDGTISSSKLVSANIAGDRLAANTLSNTVFQTGSVENYIRGANLDFGMRNRIINGAMRIDQRYSGSANTPTNGSYVIDRFKCGLNQSAKYSVQQDSSANTVAGFTSSMKVTSLSSYSVGSSDYFMVGQEIEGNNLADLRWGTANARPVTLSFFVRSSLTGTFGGALRNNASDRSYPFSYTISAADTWEYKTLTISGDTSGTWLTNTSTGINLTFGLGVGSTLSGTAGAWAGANYVSATGAVSVVGTNAATFYVTGVQLEEGSTATPFEYRQYGTELALCQRYYQKIFGQNSTTLYLGRMYSPGAGSGAPLTINLKVSMRTAPTGTVVGTWQLFGSTTQPQFSGITTEAVYLYVTASGAGDTGFYTDSASVGANFSAEL